MHRIQSTLTALLLVAVCCDIAMAQKVFNNSRAGKPLGGRTTGTYSFNTGGGSRWGSPATSGFGSTSRRPNSSPKWNLRPTYNSSRSVTPRYDASSFARGRSLSYSSAPRSSRAYSIRPSPVYYGNGLNHVHLHPYDQARFFNGLPLQYSFGQNFGFVAPPTIIAPPIVIPFGGVTSSFLPPQPDFAPHPSTLQNPLPQSQAVPQNSAANYPPTQNGEVLSQKIPADESPIVDEFGGPNVDTRMKVAAADRIRSLRYQTSGDAAFRKQDYGSATAFFKAAAETAPGRRAPWIRLAWSNIAEQNYADSVVSLKTALAVDDDVANSWIAGRDLYGSHFATNGDRHSDQVWSWLQQRPNSTDRLLLVAGFQQMRGYSGMAREMLEAAAATGLDLGSVQAMREIANDQRRQPADPVDNISPALPREFMADDVPKRPVPQVDDTGIRMRGRELLPPVDAQPKIIQPPVGDPQPLPTDAAMPEESESSQDARSIPLVPEVSGILPMSLKIPVNK